jgi:phosphatidylinositol alpha-mannosyltransferase
MVSSPTLRRLERETLRQASRVFAISPASRAGLAEAGGLDPETIAILPIPVDTVLFAPSPDEEWRAQLEDAPTLVYVGRRDDPRKNLPLLLDAFRAIRRDRPTTRLLLVGSGPATREHEGLEVAGEVPDVARLLRQGTLFVLPSLQEGFGIAAAEALACGLPVVTTPSGGPEDLVERSGGGCVLEGFSSVELASTVLALLREPDTLERMRAAGRAYVAQEHAPTRFRKLLGDALR